MEKTLTCLYCGGKFTEDESVPPEIVMRDGVSHADGAPGTCICEEDAQKHLQFCVYNHDWMLKEGSPLPANVTPVAYGK